MEEPQVLGLTARCSVKTGYWPVFRALTTPPYEICSMSCAVRANPYDMCGVQQVGRPMSRSYDLF